MPTRTFTITQSGSTRRFTVQRGVGAPGPAGSNTVTPATTTTITGLIKGAAGNIAQAISGTDYEAPGAAATAQAAAQSYADGLVVGLLDDRGDFDASLQGTYPTTGGSGIGGAIKKGDCWRVSGSGAVGSILLEVGDMVRALVDDAGPYADPSWGVLNYSGEFVTLGDARLTDERVPTSAGLAAKITGATSKATPVDADEIGITDSATNFSLKKFTFANLWAWILAKTALERAAIRTALELAIDPTFSGTVTASSFTGSAEGLTGNAGSGPETLIGNTNNRFFDSYGIANNANNANTAATAYGLDQSAIVYLPNLGSNENIFGNSNSHFFDNFGVANSANYAYSSSYADNEANTFFSVAGWGTPTFDGSNITGVVHTTGTLSLGTFSSITGTLADANISSAATWNAKQAALVSGTNIKTVNGSSLLGSGNLSIVSDLTSGPVTSSAGVSAIAAGQITNAMLAGSIDLTAKVTGNLPVTNGGTGRATSTTAYGLIAAGTTATGAQQTLAAGATTEVLVGGGASALPVWTTATGTGAPMRGTSPTITTSMLFAGGGSLAESSGTLTVAISGNILTGSASIRNTGGFRVGGNGTTTRTVDIFSYSNNLAMVAGNGIVWESSASQISGANDTGLFRNAAGVVEINNGTAGVLRDMTLRNLTASGNIITTPQALSGAGAVDVVTAATAYTSTGVAQVLTLANGTNGQIKQISHVSRGSGTGTGIITPTTANGFTTITLTATGDSVSLQYFTTGGWCIIGSRGATIS